MSCPWEDTLAALTSHPVAGPTACGTLTCVSDVDEIQWWTVPEVVEHLDQPLLTVRRWLEDREILGLRRGERSVLMIPVLFFDDEGPLPHLKGTFTVLADGGMKDDEIIHWLFEPDPTLPVEGGPIHSMLAGFKTEVRRRAMETAF